MGKAAAGARLGDGPAQRRREAGHPAAFLRRATVPRHRHRPRNQRRRGADARRARARQAPHAAGPARRKLDSVGPRRGPGEPGRRGGPGRARALHRRFNRRRGRGAHVRHRQFRRHDHHSENSHPRLCRRARAGRSRRARSRRGQRRRISGRDRAGTSFPRAPAVESGAGAEGGLDRRMGEPAGRRRGEGAGKGGRRR